MFVGYSNISKRKKIEYLKIDDTYAKVFYNGSRVGHIENHHTHFIIEVYFKRISVLKKNKKNISKFIHDYCAWHQFCQYSNEQAERRGFRVLG